MKQKLLLICLLLMTAISARAVDFEAVNADGATIYYSKASTSIESETLNNNNYYECSITLPSAFIYNNYNINGIFSDVFQNCSALTSIIIPLSVTTILYYVFNNCEHLASNTIPTSVINFEEGIIMRSPSFSQCEIFYN